MYALLDKFFFVFHSFIIVFNLLGWIWEKTRVANLIMLLLTAFSWFILGIWYGFGYCFCTDWHYQVRMKLGYFDMPSSYVKFLIDSLTGLDINAKLVDIFTFTFFLLALIASILINMQDWRNRRQVLTFDK
ncbi:MAG: DUF2784 domain-containing protein [Deltaproteobacteria bacterium]|nr:DUF2784 domain-containing protein [Deltaproteobacteria bacterium]